MEIQEKINQIETLFNIDLKCHKRNRLKSILRLFITREYPEMSCYAIAKHFKMNDTNVSEYRNKVLCFNQRERLESIKKCIELNDASHLSNAKFPILEYKQRPKESDLIPVKIKYKPKEVFMVLRKHVKSPLYDKHINLWNKLDWKEFERLKSI